MATKDVPIGADGRAVLVKLLVAAEAAITREIPVAVVPGRVGTGAAARVRAQERVVAGPYRRRVPREEPCRFGGPLPFAQVTGVIAPVRHTDTRMATGALDVPFDPAAVA